jgi:hypothetical protein
LLFDALFQGKLTLAALRISSNNAQASTLTKLSRQAQADSNYRGAQT